MTKATNHEPYYPNFQARHRQANGKTRQTTLVYGVFDTRALCNKL